MTGRTKRFKEKASFKRKIEIENYAKLSVKDDLRGRGAWEGRFQLPGDLDVSVDEDKTL